MKFETGSDSRSANCVIYNSNIVAECHSGSWEQRVKMAKLLAAAPELLDALQDLLQEYNSQMSAFEKMPWQVAAEQAIAKALGNAI